MKVSGTVLVLLGLGGGGVRVLEHQAKTSAPPPSTASPRHHNLNLKK